MLGSLHDAEDALQDALLRAWRGLDGFEGRSSLRSWLHRIATNTCLDVVKRRPRRVLPIDYGPPAANPREDPGEPLTGSVWVEPYPDGELGLGTALPRRGPLRAARERRAGLHRRPPASPPRQRAVLILREVLGFSAREVAETLDNDRRVGEQRPPARPHGGRRAPPRAESADHPARPRRRAHPRLVEGFVDAWDRGDVDDDGRDAHRAARFAMPPYASWYRGPGRSTPSCPRPTACGVWFRRAPTGSWRSAHIGGIPKRGATCGVLDVLTLRWLTIAAVTAFGTPGVFGRFGLPDELAPGGDR